MFGLRRYTCCRKTADSLQAPLGDRNLHERVKFRDPIAERSPPLDAWRNTVSRDSDMDVRIHVICCDDLVV